ncbi:MAG: hypothetical protein RIB43_04665 [Rhodospirillaceae bacterium]|jgi:hypothetical protein
MYRLSVLKLIIMWSAIFGLQAFLADTASAISDQKIEDARYACTTFIEGDGDKGGRTDAERAQLARFWLISFLTGAYEADEILEFSDDIESAEREVISHIKAYCDENSSFSIHAAAVRTRDMPRPLPTSTAIGLDPTRYSCAAYSSGQNSKGDAKSLAEAAEFWAFAFVQGNVSARYHPRLVVAHSNKRKIVRALKQSCSRNPTRTLLDQTAEIADRVKPESR